MRLFFANDETFLRDSVVVPALASHARVRLTSTDVYGLGCVVSV